MSRDLNGDSASFRRRLLRQAVADNVHTKEGTRPGRPRRPVPDGRLLAGFVALVFSFALLMIPSGSNISEVPPGSGSGARPLTQSVLPAVDLPPVPTRIGSPDGIIALGTVDSAIFPVGVRRVMIDAGHGGRDHGTVTPDGLREKDIALDITLRLESLLEETTGLQVLLTRDRDETILLRERAEMANRSRVDLFVSIHVNWLEPRTNRGVETFFLGPTADPFLVELASRENRESGYALADVRRLLDGIYRDVRQQQSRGFAREVQRSLYHSLSEKSPEIRDRGVKSAPFLVLVATDMPAILAEVSSLSNQREAELLATAAYRQRIAEALREGIESYTDSLAQAEGRGS